MNHRIRSSRNLFPVIAIVAILAGSWSLMTSKGRAADKLASSGYTDVLILGWEPLTMWCSTKTGIAYRFSAKLGGTDRRGYVCSSPIFSFIVD